MWGRNSEAYSECPFLTGEFSHAVIKGMRSDERGGGRFIQVRKTRLGFTAVLSGSSRETERASKFEMFIWTLES